MNKNKSPSYFVSFFIKKEHFYHKNIFFVIKNSHLYLNFVFFYIIFSIMEKNRKITLKEIAAAAGCSVAVASRALSTDVLQNRTVAADTAKNIIAAAKNLGYHPRLSRIRRRAAGIVGVFIPESHTSLMLELLTAIAAEANAADTPIHCYSNANAESYRHFVRNYADSTRNLGILAYYPPDPDDVTEFLNMYETLKRRDAQVVLMHNNAPKDFPALSVRIDNYHGGLLAGRYLGHQQLREYFILSNTMESDYRKQRVYGFMDGLAETRMAATLFQMKSDALAQCGTWLEKFQAILTLVDWKQSGGVGVFIDNDPMTLLANSFFAAHGIAVGKQLKLIGYDDLSTSVYAYPMLTTVRQPFHEMGETAMRKLIHLMKGGRETSEILQPTLVVRDSA